MIEDIFFDIASQFGIEKVPRAPEFFQFNSTEKLLSVEDWFKNILDETKDHCVDFSRTIIESRCWYVEIQGDGAIHLRNVQHGEFDLAIDRQVKSVKGKKRGQGGKLLAIFVDEPKNYATKKMTGRELLRSLTDSVDGLLVHLPNKAAVEFPRSDFRDFNGFAEMCELEDMLLFPANNQIEKLLAATWFVEKNEDGSLLLNWAPDCKQLVHVHTHPSKASSFDAYRLQPMSGHELFQSLLDNQTANGIVVNLISTIGVQPSLRQLFLSRSIVKNIVQGLDTRVGVNPLPIRNTDEISDWLDMRKFPVAGRKIIDAPFEEYTLYRAVVPQGCEISMQEAGKQKETPGPTWSPVFIQSKISPISRDEPSRIVCPGFYAEQLGAHFLVGGSDPRRFNPGSNFLIGKKVDDYSIEQAKRRERWASELLKFLPPGVDTIPRDAFHTAKGASLVQEFPHAAKRDWIEATLKQAQKFTKRWVWFNS
ncbi:hypothetical protein KF913_11095 [Candidatus Obscuribacterales bacterium]|nr:hypothetical protein [Candidatus Obscuribacterales bacterium]